MQLHLTFDKAGEFLRGSPDGSFVVRRSQSAANTYAIAVVQEGKSSGRIVWHGLINTSADGRLHFQDQPDAKFPTFDDFVMYFTTHPYATDSKGVPHYLLKPDDVKVCAVSTQLDQRRHVVLQAASKRVKVF